MQHLVPRYIFESHAEVACHAVSHDDVDTTEFTDELQRGSQFNVLKLHGHGCARKNRWAFFTEFRD